VGLLEKFDIEKLIERILEHIDVTEIVREVMANLTIQNLDLYFVVQQLPDSENYDFIGMAYSRQSADTLALENSKAFPCKIIRFDMGKLVALVERLGAAKDISSLS